MTEILARFTADNTPVVFIADTTNYDKGTIQAWTNGPVQTVSLDSYHTTLPMSAKDEEIMRQRYMKAFNDENVFLRYRLPRRKLEVADVLSKTPKKSPTQAAVVEHTQRASDKPMEQNSAATTPTPEQLMAVLEQQRVEFAQQMAASNAMLAQAIEALSRPQRRAAAKVPASQGTPRATASKKAVVSANRKPRAKPIQTKI